MKILPSERAMGLVTLLSGLAVPLAFVFGSRILFEVTTTSALAFDVACWLVNPFGVLLFSLGFGIGLWPAVAGYVIGTMLSAVAWGMIDGFMRARKSAD